MIKFRAASVLSDINVASRRCDDLSKEMLRDNDLFKDSSDMQMIKWLKLVISIKLKK